MVTDALPSTLWLASLRHVTRHPWQLALAVLGIALGIAVVVSVDVANGSARHAFELSSRALNGRATGAVSGGPAGLKEGVYVRLRRAGVRVIAPVVEGEVMPLDGSRRVLTLLGVDPFAETQMRPWAARVVRDRRLLATLLLRPGSVLLAADTARALGVHAGDTLAVLARGRRVRLHVAGVLPSAAGGVPLGDVALTDIASAQELLGMLGRLSRIDVAAPLGVAGARVRARIRALLPPGATLAATDARVRATLHMTRAFDLNLLMLSLLALIVGTFLIYNTMTFAVVQRRALFGVLRALGATRRQVFALVLAEAGVLGALGAALGVALGVALAGVLVHLVTRTINDLYFTVTVRALSVPAVTLVKGFVLGTVAALVAAALPAWEATRVAPGSALRRSGLERRVRGSAPRGALAGLALLALGGALLAWPGNSLAAGFGALFAVVLGFSLFAPLVAVAGASLLAPAGGLFGGVAGVHAVRGVAAGASRNAVAIAALSVAVAATVGMGVMVRSFRGSVARWLETTLRADLYVGSPGAVGKRVLAPAVVTAVRRLPGVAALSMGRSVQVGSPDGPVHVLALVMAPASYAGFDIIEGSARRAWPAFHGGAVLVSEPFAYHHHLAPGGRVTLRTDAGPHAFRVAAVYRDYGSEQGTVLMARAVFDRWWHAPGYATLGVYANPGVDLEALAAAIRALAPPGRPLLVRSNRAIRVASLAVFDRTFTITRVLRALAGIVAFVGVLSALMALQLERAREVAVLRAQGMTRAQVWAMVECQTGAVGLLAGLLSLPLGLAMAVLLVEVVNRRSFGWSIHLQVAPVLLLEALALALGAALLAGVYPAARMARTSPVQALREE